MTKIEKLEYYIQATKEKIVYSPSQQVEIWITLMRLETDLKRENKQSLKGQTKGTIEVRDKA